MRHYAERALFLWRKLLRRVAKAAGTPHQIALGIAVGFFVGWLPIIGIQMVVAIAVCKLLNANKVVSLLPVWITTPPVAIPIFSFNYWVGWLIVGGPPIAKVVEVLTTMFTPGPPTGAGWFADWWANASRALREMTAMGWDMQLPLWLGCVLVGLCLAVLSYFLTRRSVEGFHAALARKRARRQEAYRHRRGWDRASSERFSQPPVQSDAGAKINEQD